MGANNNYDLIDVLLEQRDHVRDWLRLEAADTCSDQLHLVESSSERAYWHHGYQAALADVIRQLTANHPSHCISGRPN
jgi:hypothetical protein